MPTSICPECTEEVYVDGDCEQGDHVVCDECGSKLTVVGLDPVELDLHTEEAEASETDDFGTYDFDEDRY
jgi:lysine biosynthesis protein LysW